MRIDKIFKIAEMISKRYGVESFVVVNRLEKDKIEIRTELPI